MGELRSPGAIPVAVDFMEKPIKKYNKWIDKWGYPHDKTEPPCIHPSKTLPSDNQTWRGGKLTIELGDFPIKTSIDR